MKSNIFITGFSGTGKTTSGREAARSLGWRYVDTDEEVMRSTGKTIEDIFAESGEAEFRRLARDALKSICEGDKQVVSTGGGIVLDEHNRALMEQNGIIVCLEARPETIFMRLSGGQGRSRGPVVRPLLQHPDPLSRIRELKTERQPLYSLAHWTIHTDFMAPADVAREVFRAWTDLSRRLQPEAQSRYIDLAATVRTASGEYPVWVGWGIVDGLGERVLSVIKPRCAYVITDEGAVAHGRRAQGALETAGVPSHLFVVPSGEKYKKLETVQHIYG